MGVFNYRCGGWHVCISSKVADHYLEGIVFGEDGFGQVRQTIDVLASQWRRIKRIDKSLFEYQDGENSPGNMYAQSHVGMVHKVRFISEWQPIWR
jgi:hypothetical protein